MIDRADNYSTIRAQQFFTPRKFHIMAKTLKLKTKHCRMVANQIAKNLKKGLTFNIDDPYANSFTMGCIGSVCRELINSSEHLKNCKVYYKVRPDEYRGFGFCLNTFLGLEVHQIGIGSGDLWQKYSHKLEGEYKPTGNDAIKMLRNLASGEWTTE